MNRANYFVLVIVISVIIIILSGCGGGEGNLGISSTPTPSFITKSVSGYAYYSPSSYEDGIKDNFVILDVPVNTKDSSGNEPLLTQMTSYLQTEEASDWTNPDNQEMYSQITSELPTWKPLPEYNSSAKIMSVYSDPNTDTPLSIGSDGHFEGAVNVKTTDSTVNLQVVTEDNKYNETQAVSSSDITSQANTAELKSCPDRILSLPGGIELFEVYCPSVNLKQAGLTFTLNNSSLGCVTKPFYLTICGKANYNVAYGFFYAKKGLTTPIDSIITAKTTTGLTLSIFTEVIKTTASISGQVKGSPIFGYVYSIGTDELDILDASGNYRLPKVFKGHFREVVAVWWANEGGKLLRHREVKIIPFFNGGLTGVNFNEVLMPTPTPITRLPSDPYYDTRVSNVIYQFGKWKDEMGKLEAIKETVNWLNGSVPNIPRPDGIISAEIDGQEIPAIWIYFSDGMCVRLDNREYTCMPYEKDIYYKDTEPVEEKKNFSDNKFEVQKAVTCKSRKILMLNPFLWDDENKAYAYGTQPPETRVYNKIANDLDKIFFGEKKVYDIRNVATHHNSFEFLLNEMSPDYNDPNKMIIPCELLNSKDNVLPEDFNMSEYGVIYIVTHFGEVLIPDIAQTKFISCGLMYKDDPNTEEAEDPKQTWTDSNKGNMYNRIFNPYGIWFYNYTPYKEDKENHYFLKELLLTSHFFRDQNFDNSIIYMNVCQSEKLKDVFPGHLAYIGYNKDAPASWSLDISYSFFYLLIHGLPGNKAPASIGEVYNFLIAGPDKMSPGPVFVNDPTTSYDETKMSECELKAYVQTGIEIYFPAVINVTVEKNKTNPYLLLNK